ncbi:MAG: ABC transporter ATP-binding protein, partial [Clostridiales bacterium]|nr:ABC transporter ATP-binding protein [Clostridiales bacterium]
MRQVWARNRGDIARYALLGIGGKLAHLTGIRLFGGLLDGVAGAPVAPALLWLYAGLLIAAHGLFYLQNHPDQRLRHGIRCQLKLDALAKMATIDLTAWQQLGTGMLVERIESGAQAGSDMAVNFYLRLAAEIVPEMAFSLCFIALVDRRVALYALAGYLVVFVVTRLMLKALYRQKERVLTGEEAFSRLMVRGLMEMPVFRLGGWYRREIDRASAISREIVGGKARIMMIHEGFFALFAAIVALFKVALIGYGFATRSVTVGALAMLVAYLDSVYQPIAVFNVLYVEYKLNSLAYQRYLAVLRAADTPHLNEGEPAPEAADISFERVHCAYGGREVYRDLSFSIPAGRVVAIAGESGAGKSSLLRQLTGLIPAASGRILVGGRDVSRVNLGEYYRKIAYLPQDAPVFDGTVRENLAFGAPIGDERLLRALRDACLGPLMDR